MIHSPRRLSPTVRNGPIPPFPGSFDREVATRHNDIQIQRPKTRDGSSNGLHTLDISQDSMRKRLGSRQSTAGSDKISRGKNLHSELKESEQDTPIQVTSETPSQVEDSQSPRLSSSPPPSTCTTISSTASRSTTDARSISTTDSEHDSQELNEALSPLQQNNSADLMSTFNPMASTNVDPTSFDLIAPPAEASEDLLYYSLEAQSELLFSHDHLREIFNDPSLLLKFTYFLSSHRVSSIPVLVYYLDSIKALKAISYANAIAEALEPVPNLDFTTQPSTKTQNNDLEKRAQNAFDILVREDLPAYITYVYTHTVSLSIQRRITGTLPSHLREASEGLAEVFCMTDPSRPGNPIIFTSEEFHRTTQYGIPYAIGRNCRFLQGPKTNPLCAKRFAEKVAAGMEHTEVILNYRRDGSPFMNLLMTAPLCDSKGNIRYYLGAQVDVSGLVKECSELESYKRLVSKVRAKCTDSNDEKVIEEERDEFRELSEMLNLQEIDTVRRCGGKIHKETQECNVDGPGNWIKPRVLINPISPTYAEQPQGPTSHNRWGAKTHRIYEHYLLVRPHPSMYILFASPSLRVPGILQCSLMSKIGGSQRVRDELIRAFAEGNGVTAKVKWVSKCDPEGRNRWIHCTPLLAANGAIGVWMVVIVDDENTASKRNMRMAPPIDPEFGRTYPPSPSFSPRRESSGLTIRKTPSSIREGSLHSLPDSPYSHQTFDLTR